MALKVEVYPNSADHSRNKFFLDRTRSNTIFFFGRAHSNHAWVEHGRAPLPWSSTVETYQFSTEINKTYQFLVETVETCQFMVEAVEN